MPFVLLAKRPSTEVDFLDPFSLGTGRWETAFSRCVDTSLACALWSLTHPFRISQEETEHQKMVLTVPI